MPIDTIQFCCCGAEIHKVVTQSAGDNVTNQGCHASGRPLPWPFVRLSAGPSTRDPSAWAVRLAEILEPHNY
jgi:hypothetical protein